MICSYCNRTIPDGSESCPYCERKIDPSEKRCPDCWNRITDEDINCPKCGCRIESRMKEIHEEANEKKPGIVDRINKIPLWIKIAVPVLIIAVIFGIYAYNIHLAKEKNAEAAKKAENFIVSVEIAVEDITKLAQTYEDMVYGQSWLDHTGSAEAVRKIYSDEIDVIKKMREPISYLKTQIENCENPEITEDANEVYNNYTRCYGYVIGENGRYPTYIEEYNELLAEYDASLEVLRQTVRKYK